MTKQKRSMGAELISQELSGCRPSKLGQYLIMAEFYYISTTPLITRMSLFELMLGKKAKK
jgi:hypothetical protein